jgi:hypothetical protein
MQSISAPQRVHLLMMRGERRHLWKMHVFKNPLLDKKTHTHSRVQCTAVQCKAEKVHAASASPLLMRKRYMHTYRICALSAGPMAENLNAVRGGITFLLAPLHGIKIIHFVWRINQERPIEIRFNHRNARPPSFIFFECSCDVETSIVFAGRKKRREPREAAHLFVKCTDIICKACVQCMLKIGIKESVRVICSFSLILICISRACITLL